MLHDVIDRQLIDRNVNIERVASDMAKSNGKAIDPALYDCRVLFPDLSNPSAPATQRWLRVSAFTTAAVGLASKFFMRGPCLICICHTIRDGDGVHNRHLVLSQC